MLNLTEGQVIGTLEEDPTEYVFIFRNEINQELLIGTDERVSLIRKIPDLDALEDLDGMNFYGEWENLLEQITRLWQDESGKGFPLCFKAPMILIDKLAFYAEFIAYFFTHNGSEVDDDFLKNVDDFFKIYKLDRREAELHELFCRVYKQ